MIWYRGKSDKETKQEDNSEATQNLPDEVDGTRKTEFTNMINALINEYQVDENKSLKEIKEQLTQNTTSCHNGSNKLNIE